MSEKELEKNELDLFAHPSVKMQYIIDAYRDINNEIARQGDMAKHLTDSNVSLCVKYPEGGSDFYQLTIQQKHILVGTIASLQAKLIMLKEQMEKNFGDINLAYAKQFREEKWRD